MSLLPALILAGCLAAGPQKGDSQWPEQIDTPTWVPSVGYLRPASALTGQALTGPKLKWQGASQPVNWVLQDAPDGMKIDVNGQIVWPKPVEGRYLVRVLGWYRGQTEEVDWHLNVVTAGFPNPVLFSTRRMDYIIPKANADWMRASGADKIVDGFYEFGRDLLGGLPSDCRQSLLYDPGIGGAHSGNPIHGGAVTLGDNETNNWRLGFLFHELGHNLNGWTRENLIEGGDGTLSNLLHGMVEFNKAAWVRRMLQAPDRQGVADVSRFTEWMKAETQEWAGHYRNYLTEVPRGMDLLKVNSSAAWAGYVHAYTEEHGSLATERCLRAFRRDGLPIEAYRRASGSTLDRFTLLLCVMANAARRDLTAEFRRNGFPINPNLYAELDPMVKETMASLPSMGVNGAFRSPVDGRFYALTSFATSWPVAEATARRMGGHLVTIRSRAQQQWLASKFAPAGQLWIGYRRKNRWAWVSGTAGAVPFWEPGYPESDGKKDGAVLIYHEDPGQPLGSGVLNVSTEENHIGIIELASPPSLDVDSLP